MANRFDNENIVTIVFQENVNIVECSDNDDITTVEIQEDVGVAEFSDGVVFVDKYVGVDLSSDELTVTDDGKGTVYVN